MLKKWTPKAVFALNFVTIIALASLFVLGHLESTIIGSSINRRFKQTADRKIK